MMRLYSIAGFILGHPLNKNAKMAALWRFFRWQFASRLLPYPMVLPYVNDYSLLVERGMTGATGNFYCGLHEADDMAFVLHFLREGDVFYDVGANIGSYTLLAAAAGVKNIVSFEPSSATCEKFENNVRLNAMMDKVTLHRCALGNESGEARFTKGNDTVNHVAADADNVAATELVQIRRFDDFYQAGKPSFIKIDVEGYEAHVFSGAARALADPELMGVLVEDNGSDKRYGQQQSVGDILRAQGFKPFRYNPMKRELVADAGQMGQFGNVLFLRDFDQAVLRIKTANRFRLVNGWI